MRLKMGPAGRWLRWDVAVRREFDFFFVTLRVDLLVSQQL